MDPILEVPPLEVTMRDHSKSYPSTDSGYVGWYKLCTTVGIYGKVFRTGYGWVEPYRLPYSLDLQLPAAYANLDSGLCFPRR